jgi:hypothetical protein
VRRGEKTGEHNSERVNRKVVVGIYNCEKKETSGRKR